MTREKKVEEYGASVVGVTVWERDSCARERESTSE